MMGSQANAVGCQLQKDKGECGTGENSVLPGDSWHESARFTCVYFEEQPLDSSCHRGVREGSCTQDRDTGY